MEAIQLQKHIRDQFKNMREDYVDKILVREDEKEAIVSFDWKMVLKCDKHEKGYTWNKSHTDILFNEIIDLTIMKLRK